MQSVSNAWKQEQRKDLITSESFVEISLYVIDPAAQRDAKATDNGHEVVSNVHDTMRYAELVPTKYASLEKNLWDLDGTCSVCPNFAPYGENGYVGNTLCGNSYAFSSNALPTITLNFSKVLEDLIAGLTITWSPTYNEWATKFRFKVYRGSTLVSQETVTNNEPVTVVYHDIINYDKIVIEVLEWCLPSRRARVEKILLGFVKTFTKSDYITYTHTMEVDPLSASLPKSEVTFELSNLNNEYNPENPNGAYKYLLERQNVRVKYGYKFNDEIEWIKAGSFYLSEWDSPQNSITATFTARDGLEYMNAKYTGPFAGTLYNIALAAFKQADMPETEDGSDPWYIDPSLSKITTADDADLSDNTIAEVLQCVANAAQCVFYQDRDGVVRIEPWKKVKTDYRIDRFNQYQNSNITLSKQLKEINVNDGVYRVLVGKVGEEQPINNPLVSVYTAGDVAVWAADYLENRKIFDGDFRADPRLDPLDIVTNENQFAERDIVVTSVKFNYSGAFSGSYEGRGI